MTDSNKPSDLRCRAEAALEGQSSGALEVSAMSSKQVQQMLHELRVHQIEMEMQNEQLRTAQIALETSRDEYLDLYDFAPVGHFTLDGKGIIQKANLTAVRLLGTDRESLIKRPFSRYVCQEFVSDYDLHIRQVFETQSKQTCEIDLTRKDGTRFYAQLESVAAQDETGQFTWCQTIISDITDRKKIEDVQLFLLQSGYGSDEDFFQVLARHLAQTLGMFYVCIDRLLGDGLTARTVAIYCDGKFEDNVEYALKDTPCGDVVGKTICCFPRDVSSLFPQDTVIQDLMADSYVGTTLWSSKGQPIGLIAVIGRQPLENPRVAESILKLVAIRAAGELERRDAEEELRRSEEKFRQLAENIGEVFWLTEPGKPKRITYLSPSDEKIYGVSREQTYQNPETWLKTLHHEDRENVVRAYNAFLRGECDYNVEYRIVRPDGTVRWIWDRAFPVRDEKGNLVRVAGLAQDITERKKAEDLIRVRITLLEFAATHSLDELLQNILDEVGSLTNSPIGFYHFIGEDEKTIYLQMWSSRTMKEFCTAEGKGQHYPIDLAGVWADAVREKRPVVHNDYAALPHRRGLPEGHAAVTRELVVPITRSDRIVAILGIGNKDTDYTDRDVEVVSYLADVAWEITGRKLAEESLRRSEDLLKRSQEIAHVGSWNLDLKTNRLAWSDEVYRIFGLQPQEFEATYESFLAVVHPEDRHAVDAAYSASVQEGADGYEIEHRVLRRGSGEIRYVQEKCEHIRDSAGTIVRSEGMVQDITDRRIAVDKQKQLTEEMQRFTYIVSHDLRGPLSNIKGFSRELQNAIGVLAPIVEQSLSNLPEEERQKATLALQEDLPEALNFIDSSITRMDNLIERVLQLSRLGRTDLVFQRLDMNELTKNCLDSFAHELQEKQATVTVDDLPETAADRTAMEQIISNLIGNAIKYRDPARPLEISITGHRFPDETVFVIRDTGSGLDKPDSSRIFQVFQRANKQDVPGEGMGLAYVRTLVRRHGGRIWCESEPGVGSTFTFTISNNLADVRSHPNPTT